jgi:hypothetical protein
MIFCLRLIEEVKNYERRNYIYMMQLKETKKYLVKCRNVKYFEKYNNYNYNQKQSVRKGKKLACLV